MQIIVLNHRKSFEINEWITIGIEMACKHKG